MVRRKPLFADSAFLLALPRLVLDCPPPLASATPRTSNLLTSNDFARTSYIQRCTARNALRFPRLWLRTKLLPLRGIGGNPEPVLTARPPS